MSPHSRACPPPPDGAFHLVIHSDPGELARVRAFIQQVFHHAPETRPSALQIHMIVLALHETLANVIEHVHGFSGQEQIQTSAWFERDTLICRITYTGAAFQMADRAPQLPDSPRDRGYGLFMVDQIMDDVRYFCGSGGVNEIRLTKRIAAV